MAFFVGGDDHTLRIIVEQCADFRSTLRILLIHFEKVQIAWTGSVSDALSSEAYEDVKNHVLYRCKAQTILILFVINGFLTSLIRGRYLSLSTSITLMFSVCSLNEFRVEVAPRHYMQVAHGSDHYGYSEAPGFQQLMSASCYRDSLA